MKRSHCSSVNCSRTVKKSVPRASPRSMLMSPAMLGTLPRADLVVAGVVRELGQPQVLQERRQVHPEAAPVALAQAVPTADRVVGRAAPRLDGALRGGLLLVGGAERHPVALGEEPRVQVLDGREV